ncbi:phosphotransferase family protein [Actinomadura vinacea]|uniref:Phosphotransferase family protein n=1 Tax=Actinomadura vinacea TaxID=115336 RepID=A0ABN3IIA2_9ACTN
MTRLADAIRAEIGDAELSELTPMAGGRSGVTLAGRLTRDGVTREIVVKAKPPGRPATGRHDVLRQADALDLLATVPGVPSPRVLARVNGEEVCFVMERSRGSVTEPILDDDDRPPPDIVRERALRSAGILAALHRFDTAPLREPISDLADEVGRWSGTAKSAGMAPGIDRLAESLAASVPAVDGPPVLVHGDFRLGNLVFDGAEPTGLIDWEIWGLSRPGVDLGWFLVFCDASAFPGVGRPVDGLPSADELVEAYRQAGGDVPDDLAWYEAFGRFKMAAIMAHNLHRHRAGRHVDPYQERLPPTIARLVESGAEMLKR